MSVPGPLSRGKPGAPDSEVSDPALSLIRMENFSCGHDREVPDQGGKQFFRPGRIGSKMVFYSAADPGQGRTGDRRIQCRAASGTTPGRPEPAHTAHTMP